MSNQDPLWVPSQQRIDASRMAQFETYLRTAHGVRFADFAELHRWSVESPALFWQAVWSFTDVRASQAPESVLSNFDRFPGARWFEGARLNYAENLLARRDSGVALVGRLENGEQRELSWGELHQAVARTANALRARGVSVGDRVAGMLPNVPETVVAMLATASLGALWSSCSPDFGVNGVLDRFGQIGPKVFLGCDGYYYNGKRIDCREKVVSVASKLESLVATVLVPVLDFEAATPGVEPWDEFLGLAQDGDGAQSSVLELHFEQLPFDHPLFIMYSSGTTGVPKCIVHGAGGTLLQHLKEHQLHTGIRSGDVLFYFTTCGWMMWNWMVSGLASGATLLLYDGSPFYPGPESLFDVVDEADVSIFGVGAKFISGVEKAGLCPRESHHLGSLRSILSTGSPLSHESFRYVYRDIKPDVCLSSISGGTDIVSCFVLGNECLPVYEGELQCPGLGMAVEIWDENGEPVRGKKGELVCTQPFPCAPVGFWDDPDDRRYLKAYFERYPGIWAHGDYAEVTRNGGMIIHGRSDSVLNPGGVRIGTAEIYRQVERMDEVQESICVGQDWDGDVRVVLFVVLRAGLHLDEVLTQKIRAQIRRETTPRHVPAKILAVTDIPRTRSGKIAEVAVRDVINGATIESTEVLSNPESLDQYRDLPVLQS